MKIKRILRYLVLLFSYSVLIIFFIMTFFYLFFDRTLIATMVSLLYPAVAPLLCFTYILSAIIIVRFSFLKKRKSSLVVLGLCIFILIGAFLPYFSIPAKVNDAEKQLTEVYGLQYTNLDTTNMRAVPFSWYDYIFGIEINDLAYTLETNILYLNNGNDSFYFDWYKPVGEGPFPVILAIHGGGWVMGNKGLGNMASFNKYFASKGYVVFDIQYGVHTIEGLASEMGGFGSFLEMAAPLITPPYNLSYTIPQQLDNIGNFTKMLELNQTKYHADLDKVFVLGRSAGGYLAAMVSLAYKNPFFTGVFASSMNIRGGIWIYPATQVINATFFDILLQGSLPLAEMYQWYSPFFLIQNSTIVPPIMIVHGTKDRLADYETNAVEFQQYAHSLDKTCILIKIPGCGHAYDLLFQSFGGQMSTYYMERFMGLELGG